MKGTASSVDSSSQLRHQVKARSVLGLGPCGKNTVLRNRRDH